MENAPDWFWVTVIVASAIVAVIALAAFVITIRGPKVGDYVAIQFGDGASLDGRVAHIEPFTITVHVEGRPWFFSMRDLKPWHTGWIAYYRDGRDA